MEGAAASRTMLSMLPLALLQSVLARLPVDARARACVVCRAWNAALAERSLWTRLDLSLASGVAVSVTEAVLRAAAARAGGQLEALDLPDCNFIGFEAVLAVVTACGVTLRELRRHNPSRNADERSTVSSEAVEALLRAAPQLCVLAVGVWCQTTADAARLLRGEPLFAPLRVHALTVQELEDEVSDEAAVLALAAAVTGHVWLTELTLKKVPLDTAAVLDAVVDAALARRLCAVNIWKCHMSPASAPALARLLGGGLSQLSIIDLHPHLDVPAALVLSNALRASTTLTSFQLALVDLWHDLSAAVVLMSALTGHQSLRELGVSFNAADTPAMETVAGATLGALVAVNAPALHKLDISHCLLGDVGTDLLADALPHNTHLRTLMCDGNAITDAFARDRLLPALQANASLRALVLTNVEDEANDDVPEILYELQDLVAARAAAAPQ
jgi:hypothetical protein